MSAQRRGRAGGGVWKSLHAEKTRRKNKTHTHTHTQRKPTGAPAMRQRCALRGRGRKDSLNRCYVEIWMPGQYWQTRFTATRAEFQQSEFTVNKLYFSVRILTLKSNTFDFNVPDRFSRLTGRRTVAVEGFELQVSLREKGIQILAWPKSLYQTQPLFSSLFRLFSLHSELFQVKHCEFYTDDSDLQALTIIVQ